MAQFEAVVGNNFIKQITSVKSLKWKPVSGLVREMFDKAPKVEFHIDQRPYSPGIIAVFVIPRHPFYFFIVAILAALSSDTFFTPSLSNNLSSHAWTFGCSVAGSKESPTTLFILCCHVTKAISA
jgi:hypothetical protein